MTINEVTIFGTSTKRIAWGLCCFLGVLSALSCTSAYKKSLGGDTKKVFASVYATDFDTAYTSVLDALKSLPIDTADRDSGFVMTKWVDNTHAKNFSESFGRQKIFFRAQYRIRATVSKNLYFSNSPGTKISFYKEQLVQYDPLEDWIPLVSDGVDEKTLLYRTGRLVYISHEIDKVEQDKEIEEAHKNKEELLDEDFEDFAEFEFRDGDKREEGYEGGDEDFKKLKRQMEGEEWIEDSYDEDRTDEEFEDVYF